MEDKNKAKMIVTHCDLVIKHVSNKICNGSTRAGLPGSDPILREFCFPHLVHQ